MRTTLRVPGAASNVEDLEPIAGLCADCRHCRRVTNSRGSVFFLCQRAETDSAFARYPRLPMRACPGFERDGDTPTRLE